VKGDGSSLFEAEIEWTPPKPGYYALYVRAFDNDDVPGVFTKVSFHVAADFLTIMPALPSRTPTPPTFDTLEVALSTVTLTPTAATLTPTLTATLPSPTPTETFTSTDTPTASVPSLQANENANCRTGPGVDYEVDDGLHKGQIGIIEGRLADNSWVWIREPSGGGGHCWVSADVGVLSGDLNAVLIIKAPPITVTPGKPPKLSIQIGDTTIETDGNPCSNHPTTTPVSASISASADLSKVTLHWSGAKSGSKTMQSTGGDNYQASLGSFTKAGTLNVWVTAVDENGAQGTSQTITVKITSGCVP